MRARPLQPQVSPTVPVVPPEVSARLFGARLCTTRLSSTRLGRLALLALVVASGLGCATSPAVEAAGARDFKRLGVELEAARKAGQLDDGEVEDVAEVVAEGELAAAKGDEGVARVEGLIGCAEALEDLLEERADGDDEVAAAAAGVLLSAGLVAEDGYAYLAVEGDHRPAFRALGARSLVHREHAELRRSLFLDLDERVRTGALRAASIAPVRADLEALVEAARLDPNPSARAAAVRAIGQLGTPLGVQALRDLWSRAEPRLREAITDAFAAPATFEAGGREALVSAVEEAGAGSVAAALVLARLSSTEPKDQHARAIGEAALLRAIAKGTREDRTYAIVVAPSSSEVLEALREAKDDSDPGIALLVLGRLAREGTEAEQKTSRDRLLEIAKSDDPERARAMGELARLDDRRVVELLATELGAESRFARSYAARQLVLLGDLPRAARALADGEADVRLDLACAVLGRRR